MHGVADIQTRSKKLHQEAMETNSTAAKVNKNGGLVFMDDNSETRRMVEQCYVKRKTTINPIVDWSDDEVWEFLNEVAEVPHCRLYDEGFTRLGCVGCPLQGREGMLREFERWPRYKDLYIRAFDKMIQNHPGEIKVASGELADSNGGGYSSESGRVGAHEQAEPGQQSVVEDADGHRGVPGLDKSVLNAERERERRGPRLDEWTGRQIYDLWIWSLGPDGDKKGPPPHRLVPNGKRTRSQGTSGGG